MFKHVLVTLDGTPQAESVVSFAIDLARSMHAEITLLRVIDSPQDWSERGALGNPESETTIRALFSEQAQAYLERVSSQIKRDKITVNVVLRRGQPAAEIVSAAHELGADVITMSTHSRRGVNRLVFGSVAELVLHNSSLPVLLIRAG